MPPYRQVTRPLFSGAVLLASICLIGCTAAASDWNADRTSWDRITVESLAYDETQPVRGRVIDGEVNVNTFSPDNTLVAVDAETVDLRQVFEDLGPIATLWYQHVQTLSNPFFEGRVPEGRGMEVAKEYLEFYFRLYGLEPAFPAGGSSAEEMPGGEVADAGMWTSFRQPFTFNYGGTRMRAQVADPIVAINGERLNRDEYTFLGVSGSGHVTGPISFVGYGIAEGEDGYTSFDDDTDLTGRIAMLLRYEPLNEDGSSQWSRSRYSAHSSMATKLRNVRDRNAAGIILVNPPGARDGSDRLESMGRSAQFGPALTIPVIQVTPEVADRMLMMASPAGGDLMAWQRRADAGDIRTVHFRRNAEITLAATITRSGARTGVETQNVGAVLRGRGSLANEWIIIGGHMDHVGYGEFGSAPANRGQLHPGADDNASGTAGILILARTLSEKYASLPKEMDARSILFIAFCAEESGLHGSRYYANNPTVPVDAVSAMLNMDMIGRLRDNTLSVMGVGTARGLSDMLRPHFELSGMTVHTTPGSSGRSDDANFINVGIPAMHFFTGMHPEYHAPGDHAYTVNPVGARDILRMIHHISIDLATRTDQLVFTTPQRTRTVDRGYAPVRLGIRPGMAADPTAPGVLIEEVSLNTAAAAGGLQRGDVILEWDGEPLAGMAGLFEHLQKHQHGDTVVLTIQRDGQTQQVRITFELPDAE